MKHVTGLAFGSDPLYSSIVPWFPLTAFRDSEAVSNLKSLTIQHVPFRSEDAHCLATSPYLTNLTHLQFYNLAGLDGMMGADRGSGFDTIICSPIMKSVKSFHMMHTGVRLGYTFLEVFATSTSLRNLTCLGVGGMSYLFSEDWSLEPLSRCDATLPLLTSLALTCWPQISEKFMNFMASLSSALFNRIESLHLVLSDIPTASMEILSRSDGLRGLKTLVLSNAQLHDEHVQHLASASLSSLQSLDMRCNSSLTNKSVLALYSSKNLAGLQRIDFEGCRNITCDVLDEICMLPHAPI